MPHLRQRAITPILMKRLKLWPVLGLLGVRQCGKSVLLRDLIGKQLDSIYYTLDSKTQRMRADRSPEAFTRPSEHVLVIDEVQKAPDLFDAIKLHVDRNRHPGMYLVSGSTEFSQYTGIRESLTGRIGILHLYPLNLSELQQINCGTYWTQWKPCKSMLALNDFEKKLVRGGMPGLCFLRSEEEFEQSCQLWLETTCFRDLAKIMKKDFDGEFALELLGTLCQLEEPTAPELAAKLRKDARIVKRYLDGFCRILALHRLTPHKAGVGKAHYLLVDSGLAAYLGAPPRTLYRIHLLIEALSRFEATGIPRPRVEYYRTAKRSQVPLVFTWASAKHKPLAVQFSDSETPTRGEKSAIESFNQKLSVPMRSLLLTHTSESYREDLIEVHPLRG